MCTGGSGGDGGAAERRRQEEARQARIREGNKAITIRLRSLMTIFIKAVKLHT